MSDHLVNPEFATTYLQTKADERQNNLVTDLEAVIVAHQALKLFRQTDVVSNVALKTLDAVTSNYKPQLQ